MSNRAARLKLPPFSKAALLVPRCTIVVNLVILAETGDELLRRQDHFGARLSVKVPNDLEGHGQSRPFSKAALLVPRCTIGADLVILAETSGELSRWQGHLGSRLSVKVQIDLEGHGQSRPFSKAALLIPRCIIGANLVILAETGGELSRWQGRYGRTDRRTDGRTDGRTDRRTEVMTISLRPLRPRGKKCSKVWRILTEEELVVNNVKIDMVEKTKFLGVIIDQYLSFQLHINYIKGKIARGIGILYKCKNFFNDKTRLTLYNAFIYPYFTYCLPIWGNTYNSYLEPLIKLQKKSNQYVW